MTGLYENSGTLSLDRARKVTMDFGEMCLVLDKWRYFVSLLSPARRNGEGTMYLIPVPSSKQYIETKAG